MCKCFSLGRCGISSCPTALYSPCVCGAGKGGQEELRVKRRSRVEWQQRGAVNDCRNSRLEAKKLTLQSACSLLWLSLHRGAFAVCRLGHKNDNPDNKVAVKSLMRNHPNFDTTALEHEISIMKVGKETPLVCHQTTLTSISLHTLFSHNTLFCRACTYTTGNQPPAVYQFDRGDRGRSCSAFSRGAGFRGGTLRSHHWAWLCFRKRCRESDPSGSNACPYKSNHVACILHSRKCTLHPTISVQ